MSAVVLVLVLYLLFRILLRNNAASSPAVAIRNLDQRLHMRLARKRRPDTYFEKIDSDSSRVIVQLSLDLERELPLLIPQLGRTSTLAIPMLQRKMSPEDLRAQISAVTGQMPPIELPAIEVFAYSEGIVLPNESVDLVLLGTGIEAVSTSWDGRGIAEVHRILKPGGLLLVVEDVSRIGYRFAQEVKRGLSAAGFASMTLSGTAIRYCLSARKPVPYLA